MSSARDTQRLAECIYKTAGFPWVAFRRTFNQSGATAMQRATARLWREAGRWAVRMEIDGAFYTERDYEDIAAATQAIAQILRLRAERSPDLDQDACEECEGPLDIMVCSQCGADAFVRTCEHGAPHPIRLLDRAAFCRGCRP